MIDSLLVPGSMAAIASIVWFVRLEGRVNGHDTLFTEREKLMDAQHERLTEQHQDLKDRLIRIEVKLNKLNGRDS